MRCRRKEGKKLRIGAHLQIMKCLPKLGFVCLSALRLPRPVATNASTCFMDKFITITTRKSSGRVPQNKEQPKQRFSPYSTKAATEAKKARQEWSALCKQQRYSSKGLLAPSQARLVAPSSGNPMVRTLPRLLQPSRSVKSEGLLAARYHTQGTP